jgi:hypothetical protein
VRRAPVVSASGGISADNGLKTKNEAATGGPSPTVAIIGAGLGRTGTLSLHAVPERLGFAPCEHMTNCFAAHPSDSHTG